MNKIDLWSLITGVASIVSFLFGVWDKFPKLKKYLIPLGYILVGFTFGRISSIGSQIFINIVNDSQVAGYMLIIVLLFVLSMFCFHYFMKKGDHGYAYIIVVLLLGMTGQSLISSFSKVTQTILARDLLKLSEIYEDTDNFDEARSSLKSPGKMTGIFLRFPLVFNDHSPFFDSLMP